jgi:hypothetical protein
MFFSAGGPILRCKKKIPDFLCLRPNSEPDGTEYAVILLESGAGKQTVPYDRRIRVKQKARGLKTDGDSARYQAVDIHCYSGI